jgi:3-methyladenine DNA glycosylase AlkD
MDGLSPNEESLDKESSDTEAPATETPNRDLLAAVRAALRDRTDPVRAAGAQAYMKSTLPSLGVRVPEVRRVALAAAAAHPFASAGELRSTVLELWRSSTAREERYAAIDLTGHRIGGLLQAHRPLMTELLQAWSGDQDFWIRRSAITSQLTAKARTDKGLLRAVIEANLADPEFFIRKAIGWALREYAKTDPDWVRNFVVERGTQLSPLSRKEAMRHLEQGTTPGVTGAG